MNDENKKAERFINMSAKELREADQLWPEILTDEELARELEYHTSVADSMPISFRMLRDEYARRRNRTL